MKIWFGCTTAKWNEYKEYYFAIRDYLKEELGCIILFDWLEGADQHIKTNFKTRKVKEIYQGVTSAIDECDAAIIEQTVPNFSSSHQINYALFKKKPTLVMWLHKDNERFGDSYLEGMDVPHLTIKEYSKENYKSILKQFIGLSRLEQGQQRYNIVLDKKHKYYLDWAASKYEKSRSLIIRSAIDDLIEKDSDYRKYLKL